MNSDIFIVLAKNAMSTVIILFGCDYNSIYHLGVTQKKPKR
jgi:hypothetical protein